MKQQIGSLISASNNSNREKFDIISNIRTVAMIVVFDVQRYVAHCFIYTFIVNSHGGYKFSVPSYSGSLFIFGPKVHKYFAWPPCFP